MYRVVVGPVSKIELREGSELSDLLREWLERVQERHAGSAPPSGIFNL